MSIPSSTLSQHIAVRFNLVHESYGTISYESLPPGKAAKTAITFMEGPPDYSFTNVVIARSTVSSDKVPLSESHELVMWENKGPFTPERFLKMMQYPRELPNQEWLTYMQNCSKR